MRTILKLYPLWLCILCVSALAVACVGCQFSGGTALPNPPGFTITSPDGWAFSGDSDLKSDLYVKDGEREIKFKMLHRPSETIDSQAMLAQALVPLAQVESERQKIWTQAIAGMFGQLLKTALQMNVQPPAADGNGPSPAVGMEVTPRPPSP